jgi:hypothetical protein
MIFLTFPGGLGTIDLSDWKQHTRLKHCNAETVVVKWFWEILDEYPEEMRARLLQFVTGSSRVSHFIILLLTFFSHSLNGQFYILGSTARL